MMYIVVRTGVYDQGVVAVTRFMFEAKCAAERAAEDEEDTYHDFEVRQRAKGAAQEWSVVRWVFKSKYPARPREWMRIA